MKKLFICLANSKKYTGRCIAGIELVKSSRRGYKYDIVRQDDNPVWIRPVSDSEHGEIFSELVDHINLLDIVEINVTATAPQGYQSENVLFNDLFLKAVDKIDKVDTLLDKLLTVNQPTLFGNKSKTVPVQDIGQLDHSLVLIKPTNAYLQKTTSSKGTPQIRAHFVYSSTTYDLPITDLDFIEQFNQTPHIFETCTHIYFTISLGIEHREHHFKLIAGVICF